jgi:hypothetical protein
MDPSWIVIDPPLELALHLSPAWPYEPKASPEDTGFYAILEEGDAIDAVEDQVLKLGAGFDRMSLGPFYRLMWFLNRESNRSFQSYLGFLSGGFFSQILLCPIHLESLQPIIDLDSVQDLATDLAARFDAAALASLFPMGRSRIGLTPLGTKFGIPPVLDLGFSLRLTTECIGDSSSAALAEWVSLTSLLVTVFEGGRSSRAL